MTITTPSGATYVAIDPGLAAAVDGVVHSALERAGRRLWSHQSRSTRPRKPPGPCEAASYHIRQSLTADEVERWRLLEGAFERAPELAQRYDIDAVCLRSTLDGYCRDLLTSGVAHEWRLVASLLRAPCLLGAS